MSPCTARMVAHGKSSTAAVGDLSDYYYTLQDTDGRKRYKQKLSLFEGIDPNVMLKKNQLSQSDEFPDFRYLIIIPTTIIIQFAKTLILKLFSVNAAILTSTIT